jgi:lysophospholipase L1-like esterase
MVKFTTDGIFNMKNCFVALGVSFITFAILLEIALRIYTGFNIFYDVEMTRYANELKISSQDPRTGHVHRPNAVAELMGVEVKTNQDGFRDDDYSIARNHKRRIIFLGDSLTLGWGVRKEEAFEALLERQLDARIPTEIINFGHGNFNTDQEVGLFLDKGLKYHPDLVVLFYFINDAEPTPSKSKLAFLGHSRFATFIWSRVKAINARFSGGTAFEQYYSKLYSDSSPGWLRAKSALSELEHICRSNGTQLKVVLLPELHAPARYPFLKQHAQVAQVLNEANVPYLDLVSKFSGIQNPESLWVAPDDAHPNARAHRIIADSTLEFLSKKLGKEMPRLASFPKSR